MDDLINRDEVINAIYDTYSEVQCVDDSGLGICMDLENVIKNIKPSQPDVIRCKDCKYQVKTFCTDKRFTEGGYWELGCKLFGEIIGYWGWGGQDDQYCSDAEPKEVANES